MAEKAKADWSLRTSARTSARDAGLTCRKALIRQTMNHPCDANVKGPCKPKINQMSSFQVENNLSSTSRATLQPRSVIFFLWDRGIYWQFTWLVISNLVLLQCDYSKKQPFINRAALYFLAVSEKLKLSINHKPVGNTELQHGLGNLLFSVNMYPEDTPPPNQGTA